MKKYVLHRFLQLIPILLGITFLSFAMMRLAGSDVVTEMYQNRGTEVSQEIIDAKRAELGLDQPFLIQYGRWLGGIPPSHLPYCIRNGWSSPSSALFASIIS